MSFVKLQGLWHNVDGDGTTACGRFFGDRWLKEVFKGEIEEAHKQGKAFGITGWLPEVMVSPVNARPKYSRKCSVCFKR